MDNTFFPRIQVKDAILKAQDQKIKWKLQQEGIMQQEHEQHLKRITTQENKKQDINKLQDERYIKSQLYEYQIQTAQSDKEATLQSLLDQQALNLKEMHEYFETMIDQEQKRTNIIQAQASRENDLLESLMKKNQDEYFDELDLIHIQLEDLQVKTNSRIKHIEKKFNDDNEYYKGFFVLCPFIYMNSKNQ
jgi:hypothetical protein